MIIFVIIKKLLIVFNESFKSLYLTKKFCFKSKCYRFAIIENRSNNHRKQFYWLKSLLQKMSQTRTQPFVQVFLAKQQLLLLKSIGSLWLLFYLRFIFSFASELCTVGSLKWITRQSTFLFWNNSALPSILSSIIVHISTAL